MDCNEEVKVEGIAGVWRRGCQPRETGQEESALQRSDTQVTLHLPCVVSVVPVTKQVWRAAPPDHSLATRWRHGSHSVYSTIWLARTSLQHCGLVA